MDPVLLTEALPAGETLDKLTALGLLNVGDLATKAIEANKTIDSSIRYPGHHAPADELTAFWKKVGAPESPEGYAIPEAAAQSQLGKTLEMLRPVVQKTGMTVGQWDALTGSVTAEHTAEVAKKKELQSGWEKDSQAKFGDNLATIQSKAARVIDTLSAGDEQLKAALVSISAKPTFLEMFSKIADITGGDPAPAPTLDGTTVTKEPMDEAVAISHKIAAIVQSKAWRKRDPGHGAAMAEYMKHQKRLVELKFDGATDPRLTAITGLLG